MDGRPPALMPGFENRPQDLTDPEFHGTRQDDQLLFVLRHGKGRMPAFGAVLNDEDLRNVIRYVRTLPQRSE